jgi:hypothetical protein
VIAGWITGAAIVIVTWMLAAKYLPRRAPVPA